MGYSVSVNCKSQQAQTRMLKFLEKNFKHWGVLNGGSPDEARYISDPQNDLYYAHGKHQIGFNYGAWGANTAEREYYFALLRWVSIQVGQRRKSVRLVDHNKTYKFDKPVPVFIYDGYDHWPVLIDKPKTSKLSWCWVDRLGMIRDKDDIAERYQILIWEHLIRPVPRKKGEQPRSEVDDRIFEVLGLPKDATLELTREDRVKITKKLLWKQVEEQRAPIRTELKRLDDLWRAEN